MGPAAMAPQGVLSKVDGSMSKRTSPPGVKLPPELDKLVKESGVKLHPELDKLIRETARVLEVARDDTDRANAWRRLGLGAKALSEETEERIAAIDRLKAAIKPHRRITQEDVMAMMDEPTPTKH